MTFGRCVMKKGTFPKDKKTNGNLRATLNVVQGTRFNEIKQSYWSKTSIWVPKHLNIGLGPRQINL
jgi:hypothetical protein